jgi:protein-serine/threonine kinase
VRVLRLVELKDWARPLGLAEGRLTYHVLEGPDPAAVLVDFVRENHVDHVVVGARGASSIRRYLGSVSAHVVAESPCTVTVVKVPQAEEPSEHEEAEAS